LPPLVVLNDSRRVGLASAAAALFRADGWPVAWVGDWRGLIPLTTVYYSPDAAAAAQRLAARFPAVLRVRPRFPGLPVAPLVVIVTREFPA
jgi:hypothetical protein